MIPSFSSYGTPERSPDLVAPGKSVTSLRVPGSYVDSNFPEGRINDGFFRGIGTSQVRGLRLRRTPWSCSSGPASRRTS